MRLRPRDITICLLMIGSAMGIAGTDLVLPAIPVLPAVLGGSQAEAQFVLATYVIGIAAGLVIFGELGARFSQVSLLLLAVPGFSVVSGLCALADNTMTLSALRFIQGMLGAAPAVFAPGWIKSLYGAHQAVRVFGVLGSLEALTPALAPIAGLWLLNAFGWNGSFHALALLGLIVTAGLLSTVTSLARQHPSGIIGGSYASLLRNKAYLRHALAHALTLSGLLVFVFGIGAVFVSAFGFGIERFVIMQVASVACFIAAANLAGRVVRTLGRERTVMAGSVVAACFSALLLVFALCRGHNPWIITILFCGTGTGLGLRGPPGFFSAIAAAEGNDSRAAALLLLTAFALTGLGTAVAAPSVDDGLVVLTLVSFVLSALSVVVLCILKSSPDVATRAAVPPEEP